MQSSDQHGTLLHGFCAAHENMHRNCAIVHLGGMEKKFRLYYGSLASLPREAAGDKPDATALPIRYSLKSPGVVFQTWPREIIQKRKSR